MSKEGPEVITGERFAGYISQNRRLVDIVDPKMRGRLILMSKKAVVELRDLCNELIELMGGE